MTLMNTLNEWKMRRERENELDEIEEDAPAKEIKDRHLNSLRRERQCQINQEEKLYLKKTIAAYKKKQMAEQLYGIKENREEEKHYIDSDRSRKVKVLQDGRNILRQKSMMHQKSILSGSSLLNNRVQEFKRTKRRKIRRRR